MPEPPRDRELEALVALAVMHYRESNILQLMAAMNGLWGHLEKLGWRLSPSGHCLTPPVAFKRNPYNGTKPCRKKARER